MWQKVVMFLMGPFPFYGSFYFHMLVFHPDGDGLTLFVSKLVPKRVFNSAVCAAGSCWVT